MKRLLFSVALAITGIALSSAQVNEKIRLTIHPKTTEDGEAKGPVAIGSKFDYEVFLVNHSNETVTIVNPNKVDRWWGVTRTWEITSTSLKTDTAFWFVEPAEDPFSKRCLTKLQPHDSLDISNVYVKLTDTLSRKITIVYAQFPFGADTDEHVVRALGADFIANNTFRLQTEFIPPRAMLPVVVPDTLTITAEQLEKEKPVSLSRLLEDPADGYAQTAYKVELYRSDLEIIQYLPLFKNVRSLEIDFFSTGGYFPNNTLPKEIGQLDKLVNLSIMMPRPKGSKESINLDAIQSLRNLTDLKLGYTYTEQTPAWFKNLVNLKNLTLVDAFIEYSAPLGSLQNLEKLRIDGRLKQTLPIEMKNLTKLKNIRISEFSTKIDPAIFHPLVNLEELVLFEYANEFPDFSNFNVKRLYAYQIIKSDSTIVKGLDKVKNLETLYLRSNGPAFPDLSSISTLKELSLLSNRISVLPTSLTNIPNLEFLNIEMSRLNVLPDSIGNLHKLKKLIISQAKIVTLPPSITNLSSLEILEIDHTLLNTFPELPADTWPNIQRLYLRNSKLTSIPTSISFLKNLERLIVDNNQITFLPAEILLMPKLSFLDVVKNPLDRRSRAALMKKKESDPKMKLNW